MATLPALLATRRLRASVPMNVVPWADRRGEEDRPAVLHDVQGLVRGDRFCLELRRTTLMDFVEWCTAAPGT